jgi:hypothetical protein
VREKHSDLMRNRCLRKRCSLSHQGLFTCYKLEAKRMDKESRDEKIENNNLLDLLLDDFLSPDDC